MRTIILIMSLLLAAPAVADDEHERARRAVEAGEILSLRTILDRAAAAHAGEFIEAELEDEHGMLVYEIKLLTAEGQVVKLYYDARTGEPLEEKRKARRK